MYKLLSEFGVLKKRYTASKLTSFPAEVKCGDASVKISLRAAAKNKIKQHFLPLQRNVYNNELLLL